MGTASMTTIYGLIDPRNACLRYVGKTVDTVERLKFHICVDKRDHSHRANWIRGLAKLGLKPELVELETVEGDGSDAERFWIASLRAGGAKLVNMTDGGEGITMTVEIRAKIGKAKLGVKRKPFTAEHRAKISAKLKSNKYRHLVAQ